jgi:hypothetical protein
MAVGETLFERVVGDRVSCEREEAHYASLVAFYALADARFRDCWRIVDATYFSDDGHVMVSWERYLGQREEGSS